MIRPVLVLCGPVVAFCALGRSFRTTHVGPEHSTLSVSVKSVNFHATNGSHSTDTSNVGNAIKKKHVNSGAHTVKSDQATNRTQSKAAGKGAQSTLATKLAAFDAAIEDFLDSHESRPDDLEDQLDKEAEQEDVDEIIQKLPDLPPDVVSLVHVERANQPFDEAQIARARVILNGMIEKSQVALDKKVIECKVFKERNRGAEAVIAGDLARLGSMLADLGRQDAEANKGISEANGQITEVEETRKMQTKIYEDVKKADEATMAERKKDLDAATFVLKFTRCPDAKLLIQQPANASFQNVSQNHVAVMKCELPNGAEEMHFQDEEMEKEATKLSPEAREQLWVYLGDSPSNKSAGLQVPYDDDGAEVDYDLNDEDLTAADFGLDDLIGPVKSNHAMSLVKQAQPPPAAEGPPKTPKPKGMSKKCTLGKPQCGLLHDNMSLMWGKMKDAVDLLQIKMDKDAAAHKALMEDLNGQATVLSGSKATFQTQVASATSEKAGVGEEQKSKMEEQRILNQEYKDVWGECKATIYEILYTNICGVKQVRGEISKKSKAVPPDQIIDCEVSDWVPEKCTKTCDDACDAPPPEGPPTSGPGPSPAPASFLQQAPCGGTQLLKREIVTKPNQYGAKCPTLNVSKVCGQVACPVDCKMSSWSEWNMCTKECEGGVQGRTRNVNVKPLNNGAGCDSAQEIRPCNTGSCMRPCTLKPWSDYSPCSQMCGGGEQEKHRAIKIKARAGGECPKSKSAKRFHTRKCNVQPCIGDEKCIAKVDMIIAVDGSGSISEKGFTVLKDFIAALTDRFSGRSYGVNAMQVGVVLFGNGRVNKDGTIQDGQVISPLSSDMKKVKAAVTAMVWKKGFTNLAQAFTTASRVLGEKGRKHATSAIMIVTDGKPSFKVQTWQAAKKVKRNGVVVNVVSVNAFPDKANRKFMKKITTAPAKSNFVAIPGLTKLKRQMDKYVTQTLAQTCPKAESPTTLKAQQTANGFKFIREGAWCGAKPPKGDDPNRKLLSPTPVPDAVACGKLAIKAEAKFFSFGTEKDFNLGKCWNELTQAKDPKCATTGYVKTSVNTYEILPPPKIG